MVTTPAPGDVPAPAGREGRTLDLDRLAGDWWTAFTAAEDALRRCGPYLRGDDGRLRVQRLADQHRRAAALLGGMARDLRRRSVLVDWLGGPLPPRSALGLPVDVTACVFDLDGVLTTSADVHADTWRDVLDGFLAEQAAAQRRPFTPFDRHREYERWLAGRPRLDGLRAFLASRGIALPEGAPGDPPGTDTVHGLAGRKQERLAMRLASDGVTAYAGSRTYLHCARLYGVRRAVVSASTSTRRVLDECDLGALLEVCIDAEVMGAHGLAPPPAPDVLLEACRRLGVAPDRAAAFQTTPAGLRAARDAGFAVVIAVDRHSRTGEDAGGEADRTVPDLADLLVTRPRARPATD